MPRMSVSSPPTTAEDGGFPQSFLPAEISEIEDKDCIAMAKRLVRKEVTVPRDVSASPIATSFAGSKPENPTTNPIVMLHGFDSSSLEFRRLLPKLEAGGAEVYALDVLGWGFTERDGGVCDFGATGKREHLRAFLEQVVGAKNGNRAILVGASLGGCIAIDFSLQYPDLVEKLVLLDPQGYVEGAPMGGQPRFLQDFGCWILQSEPLRMFANKIAYSDPDTFGTPDAMRIGRLHVLSPPGWTDAMVNYMDSGGYTLASSVNKISHSTLILWGKQDKILDPKLYAERFVEDIGRDKARLEFLDNCGHVPHLEQSQETADRILEFASEQP